MSKKEDILQAALRLFAEQGFDGTPTSRIAREAGVSEGLIFRHFGNKAGLLRAIISQGVGQVDESMASYERETDPREAIVQHIRASLQQVQAHTSFWRLVHQLRHQSAVQESAGPEIAAFTQSVAERLTAAFRALGAARPEQEALLLFALIDGIAVQYLQLPETYPLEAMQDFLIQKYRYGNFLDQP